MSGIVERLWGAAVLLLAPAGAGCAAPAQETVPAAPARAEPAQEAHPPDGEAAEEWPIPEAGATTEYYLFDGVAYGGRFGVRRQVLPAAAARLLPDRAGAGLPCASGARRGSADLPREAPVELAFWLALTDLHRQARPGRAQELWRSAELTWASGSQERAAAGAPVDQRTSAARDTFSFQTGGSVSCEAWHRVFEVEEASGSNPADDALRQVLESEGKSWEERQHLEGEGVMTTTGKLWMRLSGSRPAPAPVQVPGGGGAPPPPAPGGGRPGGPPPAPAPVQVPEPAEGEAAAAPEPAAAGAAEGPEPAEAGPSYELEVRRVHAADPHEGSAQLIESGLSCRSPEPILASALGGYAHTVHAAEGRWRVGVCQR